MLMCSIFLAKCTTWYVTNKTQLSKILYNGSLLYWTLRNKALWMLDHGSLDINKGQPSRRRGKCLFPSNLWGELAVSSPSIPSSVHKGELLLQVLVMGPNQKAVYCEQQPTSAFSCVYGELCSHKWSACHCDRLSCNWCCLFSDLDFTLWFLSFAFHMATPTNTSCFPPSLNSSTFPRSQLHMAAAGARL